MRKLLLLLLSSILPFFGAAQTGRIAHLGHGGGATPLEVGEDNFGTPMPRLRPRVRVLTKWKADTVTYLSDSVAIHSGLMTAYYQGSEPMLDWHRSVERVCRVEGIYYVDGAMLFASPGPAFTLGSLRKWYPKAVIIGLHKLRKPVPKKQSSHLQAFPKRPFQYSYWRELAGVAALGGVGWLLSKKRPA